MSTICKLNPMIRTARTRRRAVVNQFLALSCNLAGVQDRLDAYDVAKRCEAVRKMSWAPGWWKDRRFSVILKRRAHVPPGAKIAATPHTKMGVVIENKGPPPKKQGLFGKLMGFLGRKK